MKYFKHFLVGITTLSLSIGIVSVGYAFWTDQLNMSGTMSFKGDMQINLMEIPQSEVDEILGIPEVAIPLVGEKPSEEETAGDAPQAPEKPSEEETVGDAPQAPEKPSEEEVAGDTPQAPEKPSEEEAAGDTPPMIQEPSEENQQGDTPLVTEESGGAEIVQE